MTFNPEIRRAWNERTKWRDRVIGLSLSVESVRANFSPGDECTPSDERVFYQLEQLHDSITDAAERLTRAAMAHRMAIETEEIEDERRRLLGATDD